MLALIVSMGILLMGQAIAQQGPKRVALVIGNSTYYNAKRLDNPENDAAAMAALLQKFDFKLIGGKPLMNLSRNEMLTRLNEAGHAAKDADAVFVFFAGHGLEIDGENYLLPKDVDPADDVVARDSSVKLGNLIGYLNRYPNSKRAQIVVLDACRDNPWAATMRRSLATRSAAGGLADFDRSQARGTFVLFSTEPHKTAKDGDGRNSPFSAALVNQMGATPYLDFYQIAREVRATLEPFGQTPHSVDASLRRGFYLQAPQQVTVVQPPVPPVYQAGQVLPKDCDVCPELVYIPAGEFTMGSPASELGRFDNEGSQRQIRVEQALGVGRYEVTFDQWDACVAGKGCEHSPSDTGRGRGTRPVINVSWNDAQQYVRWLSQKTGQRWRLLTEAEWEYAARAGTKTPFAFGETISTQQANYDGREVYGNGAKGEYRAKTLPVGSLAANAWGLSDMHGNVWEWVQDCYAAYDAQRKTSEAVEATDCKGRVLRGGSWRSFPRDLRSAYRVSDSPIIRFSDIGLRVARMLP